MLKESFSDDFEIMFEVITEFNNKVPGYIKDLKSSLNENHFKTLELIAHTLKGLCSLLHCDSAKQISISIENKAKNNDMTEISDYISNLEQELLALVSDLNNEILAKNPINKLN
jgi:HPt (histidine-containing phosphotransfer) domain-containing protein